LPLVQPRGLSETIAPSDLAKTAVQGTKEVSFDQMFVDMIAEANHQGHVAGKAYVALAEGRSDDIHGTMLEGQKASIQMALVGNIKNKVVDAFYEIWRMNI
jgi:flagellar hook-basal body complex protein FliE